MFSFQLEFELPFDRKQQGFLQREILQGQTSRSMKQHSARTRHLDHLGELPRDHDPVLVSIFDKPPGEIDARSHELNDAARSFDLLGVAAICHDPQPDAHCF